MNQSISFSHVKELLYLLGIVLSAGMLSGYIAKILKLPDIVFLLFAGILLGVNGLSIIDIKVNSVLNQLILIFGSCYILFDGGASVRIHIIKKVWPTLLLISTLGVLITTFISAIAAQFFIGLPFIVALLLGSTIASTDPATLIPVFKQTKVPEKIAQLVISESAFNDAIAAILTMTLFTMAIGESAFNLSQSIIDLLQQSFVGMLAGGSLGYLSVSIISHEKYGFLREYGPLVTLMTVASAFLAADNFHASGFMAVFIFGIVLGNKDVFGFKTNNKEQEKLDDFILTTSLIMRIFIFILLGSQVNFSLLSKYFWPAFATVLVFMFIARPLTVFLCALPNRKANWTLKELILMCWTRETGVIPGALASMLVGLNAPHADIIAAVTFMAILITITIQPLTTGWLVKKMKF
ncbi:MAG: sodium:proton antiporter [Candidatus Methylopumilus sp.]|nr:sodium:proton antiporter [Candidatus Methylopumilus sp.]